MRLARISFLLITLACGALSVLSAAPSPRTLATDAAHCHGCLSGAGGSATATGGGYSVSISVSGVNGACSEAPAGSPWACAPSACTGTAEIDVSGPPGGVVTLCYHTNWPTYCIDPPITIPPSGSIITTVGPKRNGCGGDIEFTATATGGVVASASANCSACLE